MHNPVQQIDCLQDVTSLIWFQTTYMRIIDSSCVALYEKLVLVVACESQHQG